jgi:hypothetical protein
MKQIINRNSKKQLHGYQEYYYNNITLHNRGNMKNGDDIGYEEYHSRKETIYYIK